MTVEILGGGKGPPLFGKLTGDKEVRWGGAKDPCAESVQFLVQILWFIAHTDIVLVVGFSRLGQDSSPSAEQVPIFQG